MSFGLDVVVYIYLRFKHTVLGTHISAIRALCLGQEISQVFQLLDVSKTEDVVVSNRALLWKEGRKCFI